MVGEEESREKHKGVGTGGLLKGARGYLQWRADLHQASEMTESDFLKDSKGKSGERTLSNTETLKVAKFERKPGEKDPSFSRGILVFQLFICFISHFVGSEFSLLRWLSCFTVCEILGLFFFS